MAAALECWSGRGTTDEDLADQVLMHTQDRSETSLPDNSSSAAAGIPPGLKESSPMQKRLQKLSRNVSEAIASFKNSLSIDSPPPAQIESCRKVVWCKVVKNLTQLYPGSQLPEKLVTSIRKHYDSLPLSYAQAGFDMKDVFMHIKLIEQASADVRPAISIEEVSKDEVEGSVSRLTFVCNSSICWPAMSGALDSCSICCKKIQIFEKKGFTLGIVLLLLQSGPQKISKSRIENALKTSLKKPKLTTMKLPFGLCGRQEDNSGAREIAGIRGDDEDDQNYRNGFEDCGVNIQLEVPLPTSSSVVSVDEWQTVQSGWEQLGKWLLNSDCLEFGDPIAANMFKGVYKGKKVGIEKIKGCDKGNSYDFEVRRDLVALMTCGHKNILQFYGVCIDDTHGLCVVTKFKDGGSVHDLMMKNKKIQTKEIIKIATDIAEGIKFMNDHGLAYRDLNTQRILLERNGNACLGDMGIVAACKSLGEATEYETDGYRWLAPEIISGDPESVTETWMSNVYSYGMVIWEMVTGEAAYNAYSPVQAAVGIAACGLRPEIPKNCSPTLRNLMIKCWNNCPSERPPFSEIISTLLRPMSPHP